jgi:hypothetical protein
LTVGARNFGAMNYVPGAVLLDDRSQLLVRASLFYRPAIKSVQNATRHRAKCPYSISPRTGKPIHHRLRNPVTVSPLNLRRRHQPLHPYCNLQFTKFCEIKYPFLSIIYRF